MKENPISFFSVLSFPVDTTNTQAQSTYSTFT